MDMGCHAVEFFRWMLGRDGQKARIPGAYARMGTYVHGDKTDGDDEAVLVLDFEDGAVGLAEESWTKPGSDSNGEKTNELRPGPSSRYPERRDSPSLFEARAMRLFRVRFTIRRIMATVALVALLLCLRRMWVRRADRLQRAKWYSVQEAGFRGESDGFEQEAGWREEHRRLRGSEAARDPEHGVPPRIGRDGPHQAGLRACLITPLVSAARARTEVPPAQRPV